MRQTWMSTQLLGPVRIDEPGRGQPCSINWSFPEPIRERLLRPTHYTRILLEVSSQMRSYAAATLYELGARYLTSPTRLSMREDLVWWASVLTGRSDIVTVDYRILKRDTIRKALAEVDAFSTDFRMEVVEHNRGRKVEELQFRVIPKAQHDAKGWEEQPGKAFDLQLVERIVALGLPHTEAQNLYAVMNEGTLREAVEHVEKRMSNQALVVVHSPAAYLRDALKKNYAGSSSRKAKEKAVPHVAAVSDRPERLREEWKYHRALEARRLFEEMPDGQRADLMRRFEEERLGDFALPIVRAWQRSGIQSRVAASSFFLWVATVLWSGEASDSELLTFSRSRLA